MLTLNLKKNTHFLLFHRSRIKSKDVQITIRNGNIKTNNPLKFLGIIVDNKLK